MACFNSKNQKHPTNSFFSKLLVLVAVQLFFGFTVFAQTITVKGKITDGQTGEELPGVNVVIKGTTNGTTTQIDGSYQIEVQTDAVLTYSFIGYKAQEIPVDGKTEINVALEIESTQLDEVVAIGYGTVKKRDITGSVSSIKGEKLQACLLYTSPSPRD